MLNVGENEVRFTMRMENNLYEQLKKRAARHKRSVAKELEYITEQTIKNDEIILKGLIKNVFAAYDNEPDKKNIDIKKLLDDENINTPLKKAALELIDFVKSL